MQQELNICARPDIFSRGALELTFRLLRPHSATLALNVRNQLAGKKITRTPSNRTFSDHFRITLEAQTIGKVVAALTHLGEIALTHKNTEAGKLVIIRALIQNWMELAEWIILQVDIPPEALY